MKLYINLFAVLSICLISACSNPSDRPVKGNHYQDENDTSKKQVDSVQPAKRVNPEDSVKY